MVGGKVVETIMLHDRVWVNTRDGRDQCALYVKRCSKSETIAEGDGFWWQGGNALWTPEANCISSAEAKNRGHKGGIHYDIPIPRIGYSGVPRPEQRMRR